MKPPLRFFGWLKEGAAALGALLLLLMFLSFLVQVFFRYVVNQPLGWTLEACLVTYLWCVFWAAAFMLKEEDHVSFSMVYQAVPMFVRRILALISAAATGAIFLIALWPTADWIQFMAIDRTWDLEIRFDILFSVFLLFMVAVIWRSLRRVVGLLGPGWRDRV